MSSLNTLAQRLILEVPGISSPYARTLISEALGTIEDESLWSFQLQESNWITPGLLFPVNNGLGTSTGTVTAVVGSQFIIGDAVSSAAWTAYNAQPNNIAELTECQFRSPYYSLYNIVATDIGITPLNPPFVTLTLDRPWGEIAGTGLTYMIYQAYFPVPVSNFRRFLAIRDTTNASPMDWWSRSQKDLAFEDPQRTIFDDPYYVVPYETDQRPNSPTLGNMLYELYPHPLSVLPYTFNFIYKGPTLTQPGDKQPYPITDDMVLWKAKEAAYLWKEAQKGENIERGSGANFQFLAQAANAKYEKKAKDVRAKDDDMVNLYINRVQSAYPLTQEGFATINSGLNVGRF